MRDSRWPILSIAMLIAAIVVASTGIVVGNSDKLIPKDGSTPDLFLLYTGDVIGYVEPCG